MSETKFGKLVDELHEAIGRNIVLDTEDGVHREGRLSSWNTRKFQLNGREVVLPFALELNGDPMDTVELARISRLWIK